MPVTNVSLSAVKLFRECEQSYFDKYVAGLEPLSKTAHRDLGIVLHTYLERYYAALRGVAPSMAPLAHEGAVAAMLKAHEARIKAEAQAAYERGDERSMVEWFGVIPRALRLVERYYELRGSDDATRFEVLHIERRVEVRIGRSIQSNSIIDLITRDRFTGRVHLWDHKSVTNIPDGDIRLTDLQTVLYKAEAEPVLGLAIDGVIWNYLRTKEPEVPDLLKSGKLTDKQSLDTTWGVYQQAIFDHHLYETDYTEVRDRLIDAELEAYFPRFELPYVVDAGLLIRDYVTTAQAIVAKRKLWKAGTVQPVRMFNYGCRRCDSFHLCKAALTGGDIEDVLRLKYRRKHGEQEAANAVSKEIDPGWDDLLEALDG